METLEKRIETLCMAADHPRETVLDAMRRTGRRAVGCFPLYTPGELVDAAGFLPVGMWGGAGETSEAGKYLQTFCCSVMKANLSQAMRGDYDMLSAVLIPAFCDTLKCVCENWKAGVPQIPAYPLVYPQNAGGEAAEEYLEEELRRIAKKLEGLSGSRLSEQALRSSWNDYEECRAQMRAFTELAADCPDVITAKIRHKILKAADFMDKNEYKADLAGLNRELQELRAVRELAEAEKDTLSGAPKRPIRLVATGLMLEPDAVLKVLERNGVCIAADDLAQESRRFRVPGTDEGDVFCSMARRFLAQRGDPFLCEPEKSRGARLVELVRKTQADGVLIAMMKFCDPEEFDFPVYKKELEQAGIPYLYIELEQSMSSVEGIETRMEGFLEILRRSGNR